MNAFEQATTLLLEALAQRSPGAIGRVSIDSLQRLADAAGIPGQRSAPSAPSIKQEQPEAPHHSSAPAPTRPTAALQRQMTPAQPAPSREPIPQSTSTGMPIEGLAARVRAAMAATETPSAPAPTTPAAPAPTTPAVAVTPPPPPSEDPAPDPVERERAMTALRERVLISLAREPLAHHCDRFVFGIGNPAAELMFVGEAPGAEEEATGEPFVGKSGELLTKIIEAMGLRREGVYLANVLKWRPEMPEGESGNRKPRRDEIAACLPYLKAQIEIIRPKCLVALGETAMESLTGHHQPIGELRGQWHEFEGIPLMATYHPAHLLRNQTLGEKRKVWEDLLQVMKRLGLPISARQRGYFLPK